MSPLGFSSVHPYSNLARDRSRLSSGGWVDGAAVYNLIEVTSGLQAGMKIAVRVTDKLRGSTPVQSIRQPAK